ncbi:MAG: DNRLRE domain-containing protein, partial [Thermoproteales archaeon]|nr:DNRLRE domain-containing protein [Thermoproteales archaeon]
MDSYVVSGGYANDNYGSRDRIFVGKITLGDTYEMYAFLHFTLPDLPSNAIITKAQLRLRLENKIQFASGEKKAFYVYTVKESWKESTITWNNQPGTDYYVTHFYIEDTTTTPRYLYITVTKAVKMWYGQEGSHANYGLKIMGENKPGYLEIHSEETTSGESYKPTLYIYYTLLTVTVSSTTVSLKQGESAALQVKVSAPDYQGTVSLSVQGLPSGAAYSFSQSSGTPTFESVLTIATSSSTPPGIYDVYVVAESQEGVKYKKKITLTVSSAGDFSLAFNPP